MIKIREAMESDNVGIINVLKASLGETSSKKNLEVWLYKHVDNPFGKSLVLVAVDEGKIVGVRAFMRWVWKYSERTYKTYRAVDTATHPSYQGKGIFKKLTLAAIDKSKKDSGSFIFNTPNIQSKPGYLKMGWKVVDKIRLTIRISNPIYWLSNSKNFIYHNGVDNENLVSLLDSYNHSISRQKIFTPKTVEFLKWRYINNPIQDYIFEAQSSFCLVAYVKKQSRLRELRVVEYIYINRVGKTRADELLKVWSKKTGAHFISKAKDKGLIQGGFGPELTFRNLNITKEEEKIFLNIRNWNYTLGDLELF